jgi:hypothetical protein
VGERRYSSTILTSVLDGGEWSASHPSRFISSERAPGTHWIGGWVGPRDGLDVVEKRKTSSPAGNRTPAVQPVAIPTELSRLLVFLIRSNILIIILIYNSIDERTIRDNLLLMPVFLESKRKEKKQTIGYYTEKL